jgi:hypothetical protein
MRAAARGLDIFMIKCPGRFYNKRILESKKRAELLAVQLLAESERVLPPPLGLGVLVDVAGVTQRTPTLATLLRGYVRVIYSVYTH